jgi:hypothetical protein
VREWSSSCLVASSHERDAKRAKLAAGVAARHNRVVLHDLPRRLLVGSLEDGDAGVDRTEFGPTRMIVPSASILWKRSKCTPQTSISSSVIVSAKFSRGACRK